MVVKVAIFSVIFDSKIELYFHVQFHPLRTTVAPNIITSPSSISVVSPDEATFTCEADGVRRPNITWWRTNELGILTQLSSGINYTIDEFPSGRELWSNLTVLDTQPSDDTNYSCVATNEAGSSSASASLTVYGKSYLFLSQWIEINYRRLGNFCH